MSYLENKHCTDSYCKRRVFIGSSPKKNKKLSYRRDSARCGCSSSQPKSAIWPKSSEQSTSNKFTYVLLIYCY